MNQHKLVSTLTRRAYLVALLSIPVLALASAFAGALPGPVAAQQPKEVHDAQPGAIPSPSEQVDGKGGSSEAARAEEFLKGSPMAGLGSMIVSVAEQYDVDYKLIIGLAEAESNRGRSYVHPYDVNCHNAWGIKPPGGRRDDGSYLRCYYEWENGVSSIAALLARRYKDQTPEEMCGVYVQPCNPHWLRTVNRFVNS